MIKPLFQKILVAYNGSKSSFRTVLYSIIMAKIYKCSVKFVGIVDTASIKYLTVQKFMVQQESVQVQKNLETDCEKNLKYAVSLARAKGVKAESEVRHGSVWGEIVRAAEEYKADLVLLGGSAKRGGYSTLSRDVVSTQESEIIGSAHCSVLVVKDPLIEQKFKLL